MDAHGDVWGKAGHFGVHLRPVINPMTIGMFRGAIWVPFWIQLAPFGIPLGHLWGLISLTFLGGPFFHQKRVSKNHPDLKNSSFRKPFWPSFFIIFHFFSEDVKDRFWQYLTVLLKVFAPQRLSFWGPVSVPFSVRFWTPQKGAPRAVM